jgi:hypothetical protein
LPIQVGAHPGGGGDGGEFAAGGQEDVGAGRFYCFFFLPFFFAVAWPSLSIGISRLRGNCYWRSSSANTEHRRHEIPCEAVGRVQPAAEGAEGGLQALE